MSFFFCVLKLLNYLTVVVESFVFTFFCYFLLLLLTFYFGTMCTTFANFVDAELFSFYYLFLSVSILSLEWIIIIEYRQWLEEAGSMRFIPLTIRAVKKVDNLKNVHLLVSKKDIKFKKNIFLW